MNRETESQIQERIIEAGIQVSVYVDIESAMTKRVGDP
jgi:hypothetical protein